MIGSTVSRYRILAKLGEGGMGVVYEAEDTELGRHVAIKFLPADGAASPDALERFKREARAASALSHPNICAVFDLGVHDGRPYLVFERLRGRTLRELIATGSLTVERIVELGAQIASALDAAHRAGIVHRDVKPANLFVTDDGDAKVLDFGVAKLSLESGAAALTTAAYGVTPSTPRTATGTILGTVQYMSPEQAKGAELDARSDLFAFGVVLYEMATGRRPFAGDTAAESFAELLKSEPPSPRSLRSDLPPEVDELILWCLVKDPAQRCPSAAEARELLREVARARGLATSTSRRTLGSTARRALGGAAASRRSARVRRLAIGSAVAAAIVAALLATRPWESRGGNGGVPGQADAAVGPKRIAVLPFENVGAAGDEHFSDGVADEVRSKLAALPGLSVIARASSNEYRNSAKDPRTIARELGVDYLLSATVRWQSGTGVERMRVTPELIDLRQGGAPATLWQTSLDGDLADVFAVQARIASEVASALELTLGAGEARRIEARPTSSVAAWEAFLRGRTIDEAGFDPATQREAARQFERAVALDPQFALGWAWLSTSYSIAYTNGTPDPQLAESARVAAERAVALAPELPESWWAAAVHRRLVAEDVAGALEVGRRGLAVAPEHPDLLRVQGFAEQASGRLEEALALQSRAARVDPRSWRNQHAIADTLLLLHRPQEARAALDRASALNPANALLVLRRAVSHLQQGDVAGARAAVAAPPAEVDPSSLVATLALRGNLVWLLDDRGRELLARLTPTEFDDDEAQWARVEAEAHAAAGEAAAAQRFAATAERALAARLAGANDSGLFAARAAMLALLGRSAEAKADAEAALRSAADSSDATSRAGVFESAAVALGRAGDVVGAVTTLERLFELPTYLTPEWLAVDPRFEPLRADPRFARLGSR